MSSLALIEIRQRNGWKFNDHLHCSVNSYRTKVIIAMVSLKCGDISTLFNLLLGICGVTYWGIFNCISENLTHAKMCTLLK